MSGAVRTFTRCDTDGIPMFVQRVEYNSREFVFFVHLFDSSVVSVPLHKIRQFEVGVRKYVPCDGDYRLVERYIEDRHHLIVRGERRLRSASL